MTKEERTIQMLEGLESWLQDAIKESDRFYEAYAETATNYTAAEYYKATAIAYKKVLNQLHGIILIASH